MKVLITGGLGFIGSNLAKKFLSVDGYEVTIVDNLDKGCGGNIFNISELKNNIENLNEDITNLSFMKEIIKDKDLIINCAAISSHSLSMQEPKKNTDVNVIGLLNILECMKSHKKNIKLIQIGTTTQTGIHSDRHSTNEESIQNPTDVYSANKVLAENLTKIYSSSYDLNIVNVRLSNVYGPRASIKSSKLTFNNYFIGQALQKKPISVYSPGTQKRNLIYVDDAIEAIYLLTNYKNKKNETFQVVSDDHYSVITIAEIIAKIFDVSVSVEDWPNSTLQDIGSVTYSNDKIKSIIDWEPIYNIEDGLKATKQYYLKNLKEYL